MPWSRPTLSQLIERIENDITSRLTGDVPLLRRSLLKILARVWAALTHILHGFLNYLSIQRFVSTAESSFLDTHAADWGITRIPAAFAEGSITITGTPTTSVPMGLVFISEAGLEYETIENEIIGGGGSVVVDVRCRTAGEVGNLDVGSVLTIQSPVVDIDDSATVSVEIAGGTDLEGDESLRARILQRITNPPAGGSESDYIRWATSVAGVARAWPFANYFGAGTVAVVIKATGADPEPAPALVTEVQDYIDRPEIRPVTADVTVIGLTKVTINFELAITPDTAALREAIEAALTELLDTDVDPGGDFFLSHITEALMQVGVQDFNIVAIKKGVTPIFALTSPSEIYTFPDFEYPVMGTITWS